MQLRSTWISIVGVLLTGGVVAAIGCASATPPAKTPAPSDPPAGDALVAPHEPSAAAPAASASSSRESPISAVFLDEAIVKACGIPAADAHFAYDSSRVGEGDTHTLQAVAQCFATGPLTGRKMQLIGHADPRGDNDYNFSLGQQRADAVQGVLRAKGLPPAQASTTSRGAMDASGTDEAGWSRDRRVDVRLVP